MALFRRSQAAMEFLMTYGWWILVVLAAIGALAYFGVLNPARFIPESCTLPSTSGLACLDFTLSSTSAHLFVMNGGGRDMFINNVSVGSCVNSAGMDFPDGKSYLFNITGCSFGSIGTKVKLPLTISYRDPVSAFEKEASGTVISMIS
jgi:hypothetical protein